MLKKLSLFFIVSIVTFSISFNKAYAQKQSMFAPTQSSLVVNSKTGKILHDDNSTARIYPASLTKLMTMYLLFEAIDSGKLKMHQKLYVSKKAEMAVPSKLGLKANQFITVKDAIAALAVKSANDVAIVVAENLKGTEENFAKLMNVRAKNLGMRDSFFANASGLHHPNQKSTARDLAKLSIAIKRDFPKHYQIFARNSFVFNGKIIKGHNKVNETYEGAEGLKTGFVNASGYNLITAATRKNKSLLAVVIGGKSATSRNQQMVKLLDNHFGVQEISNRVNNRAVAQVNSSKTHKTKLVNNKVKLASKKVKTTKIAVNNNIKVKNKKRYIRG